MSESSENYHNHNQKQFGLSGFRTYQTAVALFRQCQQVEVPGFLRDQLNRASSSIVLNLAEGYGRRGSKDQKRFYSIALGSLRETQSILDIANADAAVTKLADLCGACLWRLCHRS